jgi:hypothetical protein
MNIGMLLWFVANVSMSFDHMHNNLIKMLCFVVAECVCVCVFFFGIFSRQKKVSDELMIMGMGLLGNNF